MRWRECSKKPSGNDGERDVVIGIFVFEIGRKRNKSWGEEDITKEE